MFGRHKHDLLVVGAGPVGLTTALALARSGLPVRLVDTAWRPAAHSYSLALHPSSLALLDRLGVAGRVLEHAHHVRRIGYFDRDRRRVSLPLHGLNEDFSFVAVLPQDRLERLLEEALREVGVEVRWSHRAAGFEQDADTVRVRLDRLVKESVGYSVAHTEWVVAGSKHLETPFVVGADGHRSLVRRALGIDFPEAGEPQHFALFEFKTDADLEGELRVTFGEEGTSILWPLPGGWCRWGFELPGAEIHDEARQKSRLAVTLGADRFPALEPGRLNELIAERAPWFQGSVEEIRWRMAVRFERRLASAFGRGRIWLAGDAAHLHHPAGAQSMNVGLQEGAELAGIIAGMLHGDAPEEGLERFGYRRALEWRRLFELDGGLEPGAAADPWLAGHAGRLLSTIPASGPDLDELVGRLGFTAS
jgi:2-polyprenyl-6-methoxyphenol hydroxylase-like FAD-dependent oxidoreductase